MDRKRWIDVTKGIVILSVIFEHSLQRIGLTARMILMFHMPFFFFISGYCFNSSMTKIDLCRWRNRNIKLYIKIYLLFSAMGNLWNWIKAELSGGVFV